jgi:hypothetical protein
MTAAFNLTYKVTEAFFDRAKVVQMTEDRELRALSRIGAFVRRRARTAILRRRKRVSSPGEPPSVHSTDDVATLRNILFAYNRGSQSVVIGPVKLNQLNTKAEGLGSQPVPSIMEHGGKIRVSEWRFDAADQLNVAQFGKYPSARRFSKRWTRQDKRWRNTSRKRRWTLSEFKVQTRSRIASYRPRPFMGPALEAEVAAGTIVNAFGERIAAA